MSAIAFKLKGKRYPVVQLADAPLRDIIAFNAEGAGVTWGQLMDDASSMQKGIADGTLTEADIPKQSVTFLTVAATVWLGLRAAGEQVAFLDSLDYALTDIEWVPPAVSAPQDHKGPQKPRATRKGSARG